MILSFNGRIVNTKYIKMFSSTLYRNDIPVDGDHHIFIHIDNNSYHVFCGKKKLLLMYSNG